MSRFITRSVLNGQFSTETCDLAVQKGFMRSVQIAMKTSRDILVIVPNIQHLDSGHIRSALGDDFAKCIKKPASFKFNGINISRTSKIPSFTGENTVVWMLWPTLQLAEEVTKKCQNTTSIVATEWCHPDELNRWCLDNKAQSF